MVLKLIRSSEIPAGVMIPCPAKDFANRWVRVACLPCLEYQGVIEIQENPVWPNGFRVACGHPIARRVSMILED